MVLVLLVLNTCSESVLSSSCSLLVGSLAMARAYIQESHYLISLNQSRLVKAMIFLWTCQTRYVSDDLRAI